MALKRAKIQLNNINKRKATRKGVRLPEKEKIII